MTKFHSRTLLLSCVLSAWAVLSLPALAQTPGTTQPAPATQLLTQHNDTLWSLSESLPRDAGFSRYQWMLAVLRRNPGAFAHGNLHRLLAEVPLDLPSAAEAAAENHAMAIDLLNRHGATADRAVRAPLPARAAAVEPPAETASTDPAGATSASDAPAISEPAAAASASATPSVAAAPPPVAVSAAAQTSAPAPSTLPAGAAPAESRRWAPVGVAVAALLALAAAVVAISRRSRRQGTEFGETVVTIFQETIQLVRRSKPKLTSVSTAAADMARSVEKLGRTTELVQPPAQVRGRTGTPATRDEAAIRLEMARAQLEIGRPSDAAASLLAAQLRGTEAQRRAAQKMLDSTPHGS